jgi:hypothetical protein
VPNDNVRYSYCYVRFLEPWHTGDPAVLLISRSHRVQQRKQSPKHKNVVLPHHLCQIHAFSRIHEMIIFQWWQRTDFPSLFSPPKILASRVDSPWNCASRDNLHETWTKLSSQLLQPSIPRCQLQEQLLLSLSHDVVLRISVQLEPRELVPCTSTAAFSHAYKVAIVTLIRLHVEGGHAVCCG